MKSGNDSTKMLRDFLISPRSLSYQINLLKEVGFSQVEVLHKNSCFAHLAR